MKRYFTLAYTLDGHANTDPAGFFLRVLFLPGSPRLKKSTLTFFSLTGVECLTDYTPMEEYQNPRIDAIRALYSLIDQLSSGPPGKREIPMYGLSTLTRLLTEELGGNCCTRVILSIPPSPNPQIHAALLHMASGLTRITNAPVLNDEAALLLASRYREMNFFLEDAFHRQHSNICGFPDPTRVPEPAALENSQNLRYHIDDLNGRLQRLNEEVAHATEERVRISKLWLTSEEDRVIIADKFAASEVQIQELRIKNQELESIAAKALEASKRAIELKRANDLLNNYCSELYSKLDQCQNELDHAATQNEELSRELVHQMAKQKTLLNRLVRGTEDKDLQAEMENELKRIETMIDPTIASHNAPVTAKPRTLKPLEKDAQKENVRSGKPVNANKDLIPKTLREKQTKLMKNSELQSQIVVLKVERDKAHQDSEQSKKVFARFLDHFRGRLVYHINGITHLVESVKSDDQVVADRAAHGLRRYIRHLLTEMNAANKVREAQLLNVVERMDIECKVTRQAMKEILTAYIYLRSQAIENDGCITDLGTPPLELVDAATRSMKPTDFNLNLSAMALAVSTEAKRKPGQLVRAGNRFPRVSRKPQN
ncbi:uveal autoantigen with coiled-coil domains and ankyrin repeats protein [Clonorchis sinensis]|nr:uveal autoantigen with coiled-coil domains and ankyrin repeats protein [Clonorchis sinensis]